MAFAQLSRSALPRAASASSSASAAASRALSRKLGSRSSGLRFQSTASSSSSGGGSSSTSHFATGIAGGLVGAGVAYGIYSFSPAGRTASKFNKAAVEANSRFEAAADKLQRNTPSSDEAIHLIKQFAYSYAAWIPGGRAYVDAAFNDWDAVRKNHGDKADKVIDEAYKQLQELSRTGLSMETASKAYDLLVDVSKKMTDLAGDAMSDILENHPQAREKLGGSVEQLQKMGRDYGPEAKKQVDEVWSQLRNTFASGFTAANLDKARQLVEEKVKEMRRLGDKAWKKGMDEAKPYLDKNPKVKELVENNSDALKQGDLTELFKRIRSAVESGDVGKLSQYVEGAVDKVKKSSSAAAGDWGLEKYLKMLPQGEEVLSKLQHVRQVAEKHSEEGEKLLKETVDELKQVLDKKSQKAKEILDQAKKE